MDDVFKYSKITNVTSFRVLTLHPGEPQDELNLSIHEWDFEVGPASFEALSYVWGAAADKKPLKIQGKDFNATSNLHIILQHLRHRKNARILWIDAICIDQSNIDEKNQQIRLMGRIYSEASSVIIWIGDADEPSRGAHGLVEDMCNFFRDNGAAAFEPSTLNNPAAREAIRHAFVGDEAFDKNFKCALEFMRKPWFRRVWTFQEVFLSRSAVMHCGELTISWGQFIMCWQYFQSIGLTAWGKGHESAVTVVTTSIWHMLKQHELFDESLSLASLLRSTYHHQATDARDKIFALLPMVSTRTDNYYIADYSKDIKQVYTEFALLMINEKRHLQVLSDVGRVPRDPSLPSWVADWRGLPAAEPLAERVRHYPQRYSASSTIPTEDVLARMCSDCHLLLQGATLDKITAVFALEEISDFSPHSDRWREAFAMYIKFYGQLKRALQTSQHIMFPTTYKDTDEPHYAAFIRTIAADTLPNSTRRDPEDRERLFFSHSELSHKTWETILSSWAVADNACTNQNPIPSDPLTSIYGMLLQRPLPKLSSLNILQNMRAKLVLSNLAREIITSIDRVVKNRCCFVTERGYLGIGPQSTKSGDSIAMLAGGDVLYILSEASKVADDRKQFHFVGEAYVHGLMNGEGWKEGESPLKEISLI